MADHVRGPAPRPHREYPQIAAALAAPDPTPALPPMDGWFEDHLEAFERQLDEGLATDDACEGYAAKKRALWAAVVAYGDRRILAAALPALRAQWEGEIKAAFCEGYDTGSDPAWCEKQLRRAGVKAETWEPAATDYFWQGSEAAAALRAPTTSYPLSPEAQLSTDSLSEPTAPSGEAP